MSLEALKQGIITGDSSALARGITLLESEKLEDWEKGKDLLSSLKGHFKDSHRLGFSGPPGVGKSSFIEKLGSLLLAEGEKIAVLAVDPSSGRTGGSILGDKTRMETLSRHARAFVRPSPSRGHLGGVTSSLPGVILLCEAAGHSWVLVESVGVGQSEVELSHMVDVFTLIAQPGAGDELQAIKKGILEYVDLIAVNKMDQDTKLANLSCQQYMSALKVLGKSQVPVVACSALQGTGLAKILQYLRQSPRRRDSFARHWFRSLIFSEFRKRVQHGKSGEQLRRLEEQLMQKSVLPTEMVDEFFSKVLQDWPKT